MRIPITGVTDGIGKETARQLAERVAADYPDLQVLINNAAVIRTARLTTPSREGSGKNPNNSWKPGYDG